jgi:hypothetical protein
MILGVLTTLSMIIALIRESLHKIDMEQCLMLSFTTILDLFSIQFAIGVMKMFKSGARLWQTHGEQLKISRFTKVNTTNGNL